MMSDDNAADALELARRCAEVMWQDDKCSRALGMQIEEIAPGFARLSLTVRQDMLNGQGICHGGIMFTLADSAFAFACNTYNQFTVAQHCSVNFLRAVKQGEKLTAVATERWSEGRSGIYDVSITDSQQGAVAEFRGHSRTVRGQHIAAPEG